MKNLIILFFSLVLLNVACQPKSDSNANVASDTTKTAQAKYFCPMCTGQESDKPGKCGHCGMDLEKKQ